MQTQTINETKLTLEQVARRNEWTERLRAGDLKQTQGTLWDDQADGERSYCCLGVACLLRPDLVGETAALLDGSGRITGHLKAYTNDGIGATTMSPVARDLGLSERDCYYLAHLNDSGSTFAEIADVIDAETARRS